MKKSLIAFVAYSILGLTGCALFLSVRQVDLDAWVGQPIAALETHPVFITMTVVKTEASDGTEIWNYINGRNLAQCSRGGGIFSGTVDYATYSQFTNCMSGFGACNNIFFHRDGRVLRYTPIGTGGMRCYTTEQMQPWFSGSANVR
jgi:hypothetical protein